MEEAKKTRTESKTGIRGSKPSPLKVSKDSHNCTKIKPVIIYLRSPEVIHTQPKDFKAVVQRLTGCSSSSSSSSCTQPREDFTALQTNPKAFCPLENKDTPLQPVWPNDCLSQLISPPWNSLGEEFDLDMLWDL
ncbi:hypothetical protein SUGI_1163440 [Cryptomeria japonica]|uniref:nuclear speckle RNA-binding protein B-like n=1 Tax=Cryptomeria japonica TaxID=3369 RepID=UPI002414A141|nr:nuclear speckle RNA-binding protein B-like [Cryptomeria japonica]GLJ54243.1 hypothetical protein SUGI_1163440 [Cryptomeria japonica]